MSRVADSMLYFDSNSSQLHLSGLSGKKIPTHPINLEELQIQYANPAEKYKILEYLLLNSSEKK